jgi:predicted glycoside hydrolase/deacetylase ChbG (UPF0249 family)
MKAIPKNLRVNADDFGLSPGASRAIVQAAREGLINSVSVVPFSDPESLALFAEMLAVPGLYIGAHLTFIEVPLLTPCASFPDGRPPANHRELLRAALGGKLHLDDVRREWNAQLELLAERIAPRTISHLDSHQHVHLLPGLWSVARDLQRRHGVPRMRRPLEPSRRAWLKDFPLGAGLQLLSMARMGRGGERFRGVGTSMAFRAELYSGLLQSAASHPERAYELMVHPDEDARGAAELAELRRFLA